MFRASRVVSKFERPAARPCSCPVSLQRETHSYSNFQRTSALDIFTSVYRGDGEWILAVNLIITKYKDISNTNISLILTF